MSQENVKITRSVSPIRQGLLSGIVALGLLALCPATSWAAFPGDNGRIAYSEPRAGGFPNYEGQNWEIFTIPPQGGDPTRLTDNAIADRQPSWSADGKRLTFTRGSAYSGKKEHVWTMRADGTRQRQITHGHTPDFSPSFSPGGGRIVMSHAANIVVVRTDGTDRVRLTRDHDAGHPVFSPNGKRILFSGRPHKGVHWGLWVMHRDGTHKRLLADQDATRGTLPLSTSTPISAPTALGSSFAARSASPGCRTFASSSCAPTVVAYGRSGGGATESRSSRRTETESPRCRSPVTNPRGLHDQGRHLRP